MSNSPPPAWTPNSLYYFATPKIFGRRRGFFNYELLQDFQDVYVTAFGRLVDQLSSRSSAKLRVLYPSSVAVTENLRAMAEYALAKRAGEELCAYYNAYAQVEITVERLPRIRTDQTSTVTGFSAADAFEVMTPLVRRIEKRALVFDARIAEESADVPGKSLRAFLVEVAFSAKVGPRGKRSCMPTEDMKIGVALFVAVNVSVELIGKFRMKCGGRFPH